jgi:HSP20 family molecular chaperone IbpA
MNKLISGTGTYAVKTFLNKIQEGITLISSPIYSYLPYNVVKIDDDIYVIEIAVPGFGKQDLEINLEGDKLTVRGKIHGDNHPKNEKGEYNMYKGIDQRQFTHVFSLSDYIEIKNTYLFNGLLRIFLSGHIPHKIKKIDIEELPTYETLIDNNMQ